MKRILVADDEPDVVTLVTMLLKPAGHELFVAETGEEAIEQVRSHRPDLVILDILMPGGHGFSVLKTIRGDPELKQTKVLILSSKGYAEDRRRAMEHGADLYMTKPFESDALITTVNQLLGD